MATFFRALWIWGGKHGRNHNQLIIKSIHFFSFPCDLTCLFDPTQIFSLSIFFKGPCPVILMPLTPNYVMTHLQEICVNANTDKQETMFLVHDNKMHLLQMPLGSQWQNLSQQIIGNVFLNTHIIFIKMLRDFRLISWMPSSQRQLTLVLKHTLYSGPLVSWQFESEFNHQTEQCWKDTWCFGTQNKHKVNQVRCHRE